MPAPAAPAPPRRRSRVLRRLLWSAAGAAALLLGLGIWAVSPPGRSAIADWAHARGHHRFDKTTGFAGALLRAPLRALGGTPPPHIALELRGKDLQQILAMRESALQKGLIEDSEQQFVACRAVVGRRVMPGELRLKGDYLDHVAGDKWSFRIELSGDGHFDGMRRFSVQDPDTKGFHGESLFFETLRWLDVMAPRYHFATVDLNGRDMGIMAVEEHCAPELIDHNRRKGPVIVKYDETMLFWGLDDHREVSVQAFGERRLLADPVAREQVARATDLLRGFIDGLLPASAVFDLERLAGYLAAAELWGSWHGLRWHNTRFHYDPQTDRLEPIGYDANLQMRRPVDWTVVTEEPVVRHMLEDDAVFQAFLRRLRALCDAVLDGDLVQRLQTAEAALLASLQREFWLLEPFPFEELRERATFHRGLLPERMRAQPGGLIGPLAVRAYLTEQSGLPVLDLFHGGGEPVTVTALRWVTRDGSGASVPFRPRDPAALPLRLPGFGGQGAMPHARIDGFPSPEPRFAVVELELDRNGLRRQRAVNNPPPAVLARENGR